MATLTIGGFKCVHPDQAIRDAQRNGTPNDFIGLANSFTCPRGKEPSEASLLMVDKDYQALNLASLHEMLWADDFHQLTVPSLLIDRSYVLSIGKRKDLSRLRLVKLVDKRRIFQNSSINQQYNIRIPTPSTTSGTGLYYTDSLDSASLWTWQTMVTDVWNNLSSTYRGMAPTLPATPDGDPEGYRFIGVSAWDALFVILDKLHVTVKYDPIADKFSFIDLASTQAGLATSKTSLEGKLIYDFDPEVNTPLTLPATVRVFFPRREFAHGIEIDSADASNWESAPHLSVDAATGIASAAAGTVHAVWDDLAAVIDASGTNTNSADLASRAAKIGSNFSSRVSASENPDKLLYAGIATTILNGSEVRETKWRDYGDGNGTITEVMEGKDSRSVVTGATDCGVSRWPTAEHLDTPDLSRNTHPLYPRVSQHVQADDGATASGGDLTANASGLYPGFVRRWAEGAYSTLDACWIRPTDLDPSGVEATVITVKQKDRFIGRLSGVETVSGDTRPVYLCRVGTGGGTGTTVEMVEITDTDGTILKDALIPGDTVTGACFNETQTSALDCIYRARRFTRTPSGHDLCDRTDVTDGADIWLKLDHNPFCNTPNPDFVEIGTRVLARKMGVTFTSGANTFDLWEGVHWESRIWGLDPAADWSSTPLIANVYDADGSPDTTRNTSIPEPFKYALWDNVLSNASANAKGICIQMGRDYFPLVMARRAVDYQADVNVNMSAAEITSRALAAVNVASEAPFNDVDSPAATADNPFRYQCLSGTEIHVLRDANQTANYKVTNVARSEPILIEVIGTDGSGIATELNVSTVLSVWNARIVQPDPVTPGALDDGGGNTINEQSVWLGFSGIAVGAGGNRDPYYLSGGQKFLAYDQGQDFTPTGGVARRLYMAVRDSMTHWGKAKENWTDNGATTSHHVVVFPCDDAEGSNAATEEHTILLPSDGIPGSPNVVTDQVIAYRLAMDGTWVCVSDYMDAKIGSVMMWALTSGAIPAGWVAMDGIQNGTPAGSGIDMSDKFVRHGGPPGDTGGTLSHTHDLFIEVDASVGAVISSSIEVGVRVEDHTIADLRHVHGIFTDTAKLQGTLASFTPIHQANTCTGNPIGGVHDAAADACPSGDWGPLVHKVTVAIDGSAYGSAFAEAMSDSYLGEAEHIPPFVKLLFIERIDNSV